MKNKSEIWHDRKRTTFLGLPLSFTRYGLLEDRLTIQTGFMNLVNNEVRLYRINDLTLNRSLIQRISGIGTIKCCSYDKTMRNFEIKNIKDPMMIKEMLSQMIETERRENRVGVRENVIDQDEDAGNAYEDDTNSESMDL